jgi:hypothetical protein
MTLCICTFDSAACLLVAAVTGTLQQQRLEVDRRDVELAALTARLNSFDRSDALFENMLAGTRSDVSCKISIACSGASWRDI